jgi:hypothetical protein
VKGESQCAQCKKVNGQYFTSVKAKKFLGLIEMLERHASIHSMPPGNIFFTSVLIASLIPPLKRNGSKAANFP